MVVYGIVLIILLLLAISKKNYCREKVKNYPTKWFRFLYPMGLWLYDTFAKLLKHIKREEEKMAKAVYVKEKAVQKLEMEGVNRFVFIWLCLFIGTIFSAIITMQNQVTEQSQLKRPEFGKHETYYLTVDGMEETEDLTITVDGKQPSEEQMQSLFHDQFEQLKTKILGKNTSLEEVRTDLELPSSVEYGIRVRWESKNPDKINDRGEIVKDPIDENGEEATFLVHITYATYESTYELKLVLFPKIKSQEFYLEQLISNIEKTNQDEVESDYLTLPENVEGIPLRYRLQEDNTGMQLFVLTVIAAIIIGFIGYQSLNKKYKERNKQMLIDYPALVSKLNLLIGAGMTPRIAWKRIIADYQKREKKMRYVYEEMILTKNHIESGYPEARAYGEFGRRCGLHSYLKLGNLLEQNLRQGISGLNQKLEEEMINALEERKNMALRLGEEAGTRLLFPMFLMLGIVIVVLIVPAFMSFY